MAINPTSLLRHIKRKLGASHRPLPIDDEEILDTIYQETLYTFSNYYPFMHNIQLDGADKTKQVPGENGVFFLETDGLEIIGVSKFFRGYDFYSGHYYPRFQPQDFFESQMYADLRSAVEVPDTFEFVPPNRVEVFPKYHSAHQMLFVVKCVHPQHLGTIPISLREQFFRLAELDVKISLYQIMKMYDQVNSAYGTIELKIEDLEQAEDQRRELLEIWDTQYLKEGNRKRLYVY
jgi:hypothetical protein